MVLGPHVDIDINNPTKTLTNVANAGGSIVQIMFDKPVTSKGDHTAEPLHLSNLKKELERLHMKVVVHSSYRHNLAKDWDEHSWWIKHLMLEMEYCKSLNGVGVVVHFGKQLQSSVHESYNNMYTSLVHIINNTEDTVIFLETSSGQGTELCYKLEDLAYFYRKILKNSKLKKRIKLCIDTCHIFVAGYDIRNIDTAKMFLDTFNEMIGLKYVGLLHLNDSKIKLGCQVDRHESLGKGWIGAESLKYVFKYFKKLKVPTILETPNESYITEIHYLQ